MNILAFFRSKKQPPKKTLSTMLLKKLHEYETLSIRDRPTYYVQADPSKESGEAKNA